MTVPTKAAMKQLLDERMIAASASNRLPLAMFFLQLNLSGVIILLSLMFYANALGESFVRGLVVFFLFFFPQCVMYVWVCIVVKSVYDVACVCEHGEWGGGGPYLAMCMCVWYCFLSTLKIFAFLWTLPVLPWLFPVCIRVFSHRDHTAQVTSHMTEEEGAIAHECLCTLSIERKQ